MTTSTTTRTPLYSVSTELLKNTNFEINPLNGSINRWNHTNCQSIEYTSRSVFKRRIVFNNIVGSYFKQGDISNTSTSYIGVIKENCDYEWKIIFDRPPGINSTNIYPDITCGLYFINTSNIVEYLSPGYVVDLYELDKGPTVMKSGITRSEIKYKNILGNIIGRPLIFQIIQNNTVPFVVDFVSLIEKTETTIMPTTTTTLPTTIPTTTLPTTMSTTSTILPNFISTELLKNNNLEINPLGGFINNWVHTNSQPIQYMSGTVSKRGVLFNNVSGSYLKQGDISNISNSYIGVIKENSDYKYQIIFDKPPGINSLSIYPNITCGVYYIDASNIVKQLQVTTVFSLNFITNSTPLVRSTITKSTIKTMNIIGRPLLFQIIQTNTVPFIVNSCSLIEITDIIRTLPTTTPTLTTSALLTLAPTTTIAPNNNFLTNINNISIFPSKTIIYWELVGDTSLVKYIEPNGITKYGARIGETYTSRIRQGQSRIATTHVNLGIFEAGRTYTFNIYLDYDYTSTNSNNNNLPLNGYFSFVAVMSRGSTGIATSLSTVSAKVITSFQPGIALINTITIPAGSPFIGKSILMDIGQRIPTVTNATQTNRSFIVSKVELINNF
jgi:hypothetical protein